MSDIALDTLAGATVGNYRLKRLIAYGQAGSIFVAQTDNRADICHLRFLYDLGNVKKQWDNDNLDRFYALARQLAALHHPHILSLLDYGFYQDIPYIVTPKLAIRSLRSRLANNGPINVFTVGRYLDQITAALEYAHNHGVLHGNLSLDTIFLRLNGQIVVADFGVRSLLELYMPEASRTQGNIVYAPEQLINQPTGHYTDVYALGTVLYQLLTGKSGLAGITTNKVTPQYSFSAIQPFKLSDNGLPAELYNVISRALNWDLKQRYQEAGALANAYHRIVDPNDRNRVPFVITYPSSMQPQQPFIPDNTLLERQITENEWSGNSTTVFNHKNDLIPQTPPPTSLKEEVSEEEDFSDSPTLKRIPALSKQSSLPNTQEELADNPMPIKIPVILKQTPLPDTYEELDDNPTPIKVLAIAKQTPLPDIHEELADNPTPIRVLALPKQMPLPAIQEEDSSDQNSLDLHSNSLVTELVELLGKNTNRLGVIALLLLLVMSGVAGIMLISKQYTIFSGLTKQVAFLNSSELLLGLCIALAIGFTVSFNIISRMSLVTTKHESAYTILWQIFCALLAPLFLLFDRFAVSFNPQVLPLFLLSIVLWALVDAFLFSAFKYEEVSILSAIFPLNFLFTFVVSVIFFHSLIKPTIVIGFLIVMFTSLLIGFYHTHFRPSKGVIFGLLYSFFLGVALGLNSAVVKSFSIAPYMFAAFLFPAITNLFVFLRPKVTELRYELKVQWKKILLNAAVMDASFFFLLKAFQLGNVPQVVALTASSTLITALAGVVLLKEEKHVTLKIIAAVLATVGLILVQR